MNSKPVDDLTAEYRTLVDELELVIAHVRTCITHAENRELARVGAHGFAATGHLLNATQINHRIAQDWADHSVP